MDSIDQTYRCPFCSTRAHVVMVPLDEREEHEEMHAKEVGAP